jgi:hypothetical protein
MTLVAMKEGLTEYDVNGMSEPTFHSLLASETNNATMG